MQRGQPGTQIRNEFEADMPNGEVGLGDYPTRPTAIDPEQPLNHRRRSNTAPTRPDRGGRCQCQWLCSWQGTHWSVS